MKKDWKKKSLPVAAALFAVALALSCEDMTKAADGGGETPTEYTLNVGEEPYYTLEQALAWVNADKPAEDTSYTILLPEGTEMLGPTVLVKADVEGAKKTIMLAGAGYSSDPPGEGAAVTVQLGAETGSRTGSLFAVPEGVTLALAGKVTLRGIDENTAPLLTVEGVLEMKDKAAVTGNENSAENARGGGVYLTGTMTMSGEAYIGGNTAAAGAGIYDEGALIFSGSAVVDSEDDIFLANGRTITVRGALTPENNTMAESAKKTAVIVVENKEAEAPIISGKFGTFEIEDTGGNPIYLADKTALNEAVSEANTAAEKVATSGTEGADVESEVYWVTEEVKSAYTDAIATAQAVLDDNSATQAEVDAAVSALGSAGETFSAAKKAGLKAGSASKAALSEAINTANAAKEGVETSTNGSDISPSKKWVTTEVMNAFTAAISAAQTVYDNAASATESEVSGATSALTSATGTFTDAKQDGTNAVTTAAFTGLTADGEFTNSGRTVTSRLTLTFDMDITGLNASHITVSPSTKWGRVGETVLSKGEGSGVYNLEVELLAAAGYGLDSGASDTRNVTVTVSGVSGYSVTGERTVRVCPWIEIKTIDDFKKIVSPESEEENMASYNRRGYYKQTADIDFSGVTNWTPIGPGPDSDKDKYFIGVFDGGGYKITNVNLTGMNNTGGFSLFGMATGATFKNIHVEGSITATVQLGGIAGSTKNCTFINCSNAADLTSSDNVAGICTSFNGTMTNCYNTGNITTSGGSHAGGIVPSISNPSSPVTIKNCYNTGNITSTRTSTTSVGGITGAIGSGANGSAVMIACYNTGEIKITAAATAQIGGITGTFGGNASNRGAITACYNKGAVTITGSPTTIYAGGIAGYTTSAYGDITACYNTGDITFVNAGSNTNLIGGIVGRCAFTSAASPQNAVITACYWSGTGPANGIGGKYSSSSAHTVSDDGTTKFTAGWPGTTTHTQWGTGDGSDSGKYWKSLGSSPSTYPKLWFEKD
jgi:hypothetical protein